MREAIIYYGEDDYWIAECPSLPGCISQGETKEEAIKKGVEGDQVNLEIGQVLKGIVEDIKHYGLFVRLPQLGMKVRGLLPMEELKESGKGDVKKRFSKGKEIQVEIVSIDEKGRIGLSQKVIEEREDREDYKRFLEKEDKACELPFVAREFQSMSRWNLSILSTGICILKTQIFTLMNLMRMPWRPLCT